MAIFFTPSSAIRDRFRMFQWTFLDWQDRFCCWSSRSSLNSVVHVIIWRQGMLKWKHETFVPEPNCLGGGGWGCKGDEGVGLQPWKKKEENSIGIFFDYLGITKSVDDMFLTDSHIVEYRYMSTRVCANCWTRERGKSSSSLFSLQDGHFFLSRRNVIVWDI